MDQIIGNSVWNLENIVVFLKFSIPAGTKGMNRLFEFNSDNSDH